MIKTETEDKLIIKQVFKSATDTNPGYKKTSVETDQGEILYQQYATLDCRGAVSFIDDFVQRFSIGYKTPLERLQQGRYAAGNGKQFYYFISERGLKSLNLKQKLFYFLLKKLFLHGEATPIEQIESLCVNNR